MKEKISVIIPAYNAGKYLAEAIESVLAQSVKPWEIIVIDDGSSDNSLKIAQSFESEIKIIEQENSGASVARNVGILRSTGNYLTFLDADDLWTNSKLELQISCLRENPDLDMVFAYVEHFFSSEISEEQKNKLLLIENKPGFLVGSMMIKREKFLKVGLFNEHREIGEFVEWFAKAKDLNLNYKVLDDVLLLRRIHDTNMGIYKKHHQKEFLSILRNVINKKKFN